MPHHREALMAQRAHRLELVGRHRPKAVHRVIAAAERFGAIAVTTQVRRDDRVGLRQHRREPVSTARLEALSVRPVASGRETVRTYPPAQARLHRLWQDYVSITDIYLLTFAVPFINVEESCAWTRSIDRSLPSYRSTVG